MIYTQVNRLLRCIMITGTKTICEPTAIPQITTPNVDEEILQFGTNESIIDKVIYNTEPQGHLNPINVY